MKECPDNPYRAKPNKPVNSVQQGQEAEKAQVPDPPEPPRMNMGCLESGWTRVVRKGQRTGPDLCAVKANTTGSGPKGRPAPPGMKWQELEVTIDSGACDHVIQPNVLPGPVMPTEASRNKVPYFSASGQPITNYGMQEVQGFTDDGVELQMKFNVAAVAKPLASVGRICAAGNQVKFGDQGGSIVGQDGKTSMSLTMRDGTYGLKLWVLVPDVPGRIYGLQRNKFAALQEDDDEEQGFRRHV